MALREKVLRKKAEKRESKGMENNTITMERIPALDDLLNDVYLIFRPKKRDYSNRRGLVRVFNVISKEIYEKCNDPPPVVEEFGSFSMDIFTSKSDLDLSINFSNSAAEVPRAMRIKTLKKFAKKFYAIKSQGHVSSVHPIMRAKVPILKLTDFGTGIVCDLTVENRDGILKSQVVHMISSVNERFQKLGFLMKAWAKANNINSSKDQSLNSLSIILLVAFHLQTRDPPILPPFSEIFKDGDDPATVLKLAKQFPNYGERNKESLAELFVTLLVKLSSVETLWPKGLCASTYQGSWTSKTWNSKVASISVEDFTDTSENVARAVGKSQMMKINKCIQYSIRYVFAFMEGKMEGARFKECMFGRDAVSASERMDAEKRRTKRKRVTNDGGWGGKVRARDDGGWGGALRATNDGWGRNTNEGAWGGNTISPNDGGWGGKIRSINDGWGGKTNDRGDWDGNTRSINDGWGRKTNDGGWGGNTRAINEGWGGNPIVTNNGGWGGNTRSINAGSWGGNTRATNNGGWGGNPRATNDGGWGRNTRATNGGAGWGGNLKAGGWGGNLGW